MTIFFIAVGVIWLLAAICSALCGEPGPLGATVLVFLFWAFIAGTAAVARWGWAMGGAQ